MARLLSLFMALSALVSGQRYSFRVYDQDAGLMNIALNSIAQDHDGFLWAGTQSGVYRYDGRSFHYFTRAEGLPSSDIQSLHVAYDGRVFAGTRFGLAVYDGSRFVAVNLGEPVEITGTQSIRSDARAVYVANSKGLAKLEDGEVKWLWREPASGVYADPEGVVWFGCGDKLCRFRSGETVVAGDALGLPREPWGSIVTDAEGTLWVRSARHLFGLRSGARRFEECDQGLPPSSSPVGTLFAPAEGGLLAATDEGLGIFDGRRWDVVGSARGLPVDTVAEIMRDREGSLWLALRGGGIARWLGFGEWEGWTRTEGLANNVTWNMQRDSRGNLWAGSNRGISIKSASGGWRTITAADGLIGEKVRTIAQGANGEMWTASAPGRLSRFDADAHLMASYGAESGLTSDRVYGLFFDRDRTLWVGALGGLFHSTPAGKKVRFERVEPPGTDRTEEFFRCVRDGSGALWCPGMRGLARWKDGMWRRFGVSDGLRAPSVSWIDQAPDGALWLAYAEPVGISRILASGDKLSVTHYGRGDLHSLKVYFVRSDAQGRVWAGTDAGVDYWSEGRWRHLGRSDGLLSDDTDSDAFFADADGSVWIGTSSGISHFRPLRQAPESVPAARILWTDMKGDSAESALAFPLSSARSVDIAFTSLTFRHEHDVEFRYRIRGLETEWTVSHHHEAHYRAVPAGSYTFEVAALVPGSPAGAAAEIGITVPPLWWQTWWARIVAAAMAALGLRAAWMWRMRLELTRNRQLERAVGERTRELAHEMARAEEASRLKGEFLANMSHEIRTPMNGIVGAIELCLGTPLTGEQRVYMDTARGCATSLLALIGGVLDFSKIEAGKLELSEVEFSLRELVRDTLGTFCAETSKKGLALREEFEANVPDRVSGDVVRLRQVLINLLGNAVKFTVRGEIVAGVRRLAAQRGKTGAEWIQFRVRDTGIGIPFDKQGLIFEAFRQVDGSTTRKFGGTGLGLAISRSLVELMGGSIEVESVEGEGSCFRFSVPLARPAGKRESADPAGAHVPSLAMVRRVLVVEDNAVNQLITRRLLEKRGIEVLIASNGAEAVELIQRERVDMVLMDVQMPVMDGYEAATRIRAWERSREAGRVPILALTAHAASADRNRSIESGMDGFVTKPIEIHALLRAMASSVTAASGSQMAGFRLKTTDGVHSGCNVPGGG